MTNAAGNRVDDGKIAVDPHNAPELRVASRWLRAYTRCTGTRSLPTSIGHHHIDVAAAALTADEPVPPFGNGGLRWTPRGSGVGSKVLSDPRTAGPNGLFPGESRSIRTIKVS
jgi:hypothetical protein